MRRPPLRQFASGYPCFVAVAGILNASLLWLLNGGVPLSALFLAMVPGVLVAWFLFGSREALIKFVLPSFLVCASILFWTSVQERGVESFLHERRAVGAQIEVTLNDPSLCGGSPMWLRNAPSNIVGVVGRFRYTPDDGWRETHGRVFLRLPRKMDFSPGYGDRVRLTGFFRRIEVLPLPGAFDYESYARVRGIRYTFVADSAELVWKDASPMRHLYEFRGFLLEGFGKGMRHEEAKAMASALLFGMKQGIDPQTRDDFLRSGTIHVLSVSGLHVGLFFSVLILFLRFFPFAVRWFLVLVPVFVYAVSTGMQGPAFRAFVMFAVWCILRAFLLRTNALNTIAFAAVLLMLWNPAVPLDIGFQFSFLCVLFLLLSSDFISGLRFAMMARWKYSVNGISRVRRWMIAFFSMSVAGSLVAYLSSFAVSMVHQGLFSPCAVPAYLLMSPFAWLCFAVFVFGVLFCWVPGVLWLCGVLMDPLLYSIKALSRLFGEGGFVYTERSPWWLALLFLILLGMLLIVKRRKWFVFCGIALSFLLFVSLMLPKGLPPELLVLSGGGTRPMLILTAPAASRAFVVNAPDYESARGAVSYLRTRGIMQVDELFFEASRKENCEGAPSFLRMQDVRVLVVPTPPRANAVYARRTLLTAAEQGIFHTRYSALTEAEISKASSRFQCGGPWKGLEVVLKNLPEGGIFLEVLKSGRLLHSVFLPLSAEKRILLLPLSMSSPRK